MVYEFGRSASQIGINFNLLVMPFSKIKWTWAGTQGAFRWEDGKFSLSLRLFIRPSKPGIWSFRLAAAEANRLARQTMVIGREPPPQHLWLPVRKNGLSFGGLAAGRGKSPID